MLTYIDLPLIKGGLTFNVADNTSCKSETIFFLLAVLFILKISHHWVTKYSPLKLASIKGTLMKFLTRSNHSLPVLLILNKEHDTVTIIDI